jgi:outer membrane protein TolC
MKRTLRMIMVIFLMPVSLYSTPLVIDLETAIDMLQQHNRELHIQALDVRIAQREKDSAWNALIPQVNITGSTSVMDDPYYYADGETGPDEARFNLDVSVDATLTINPALKEEIDSYRIHYERAKISHAMSIQELRMNTSVHFHTLIFLNEQMKILKHGITLAEERYVQEQDRWDKQLTTELELRRSQFMYESSRSELSTVETRYEHMTMEFKALLGIERKQEIILQGSLDRPIYWLDAEALIATYVSDSLFLRSMYHDIELLTNAEKMAELYACAPSVTLSYAVTPLSYDPWATDYPLLAGPSWSFRKPGGIGMGTFSVALSYALDSLIPGSSAQGAIHKLEDQISQMRLQIQEAQYRSEITIINTIALVNDLAEQIAVDTLQVQLARSIFEMSEKNSQAGIVGTLDAASAQQDLLHARLAVIEDQYEYLIQLLQLEYALNIPIENIRNPEEF